MKLTILGTGNALVTECYNTCFAISDNQKHFLVDAGGGNQILKILKEKEIALEEIHDIFITHEHIDHLLGLIWLVRMIGQKINQGKYEGVLHIYCHNELVTVIKTITSLTIEKKVAKHIGEKICLIPVESGETREILGCPVTFFDIGSTKAKQFGFSMILPDKKKLSCCGDEPYNVCEEAYVKGSDWLMHEAFCLYKEADKFHPYEKHHSTARDAARTAQDMKAEHIVLWHTEDTDLDHRRERYTAEAAEWFHGGIFVPCDEDIIPLS